MEDKYIPIVSAVISLAGTLIGTGLTCATAFYVANSINRKLKNHETVFAHLHKKRAEAIEDLHKRLVEVEDHLDTLQNIHLVGDVNAMRKRKDDAAKCADDLLKTFWNARLFLPIEFCGKMDKEFLTSVRDYMIKIGSYIDDNTLTPAQELEQLREISRTLVKDVRPILRDLENMIRSMMQDGQD